MKTNFTQLLLVFLLPILGFSQTDSERQDIKNSYDLNAIADLQNRLQAFNKANEAEVLAFAATNKIPLITTTENGGVAMLQFILDGKPIYMTTENRGAGMTTNTDAMYSGGSLNLNVEGQDMTVGIWDGGAIRSTHELFNDRTTQMDSPMSLSTHSNHVAGTLMGNGSVQGGNARGMAPQALLQANDFGNDFNEMLPQATNGLLVSNHSYGFGADNLPLYFFGYYDQTSALLDELLFDLPFYTMVCSAGNDRNDGINTSDNGYDLLSDRSVAKNNITVAAVNEVTNYTAPSSVVMSSFSSWGPTDDGRIKPDISAKGVGTFSASSVGDSNYTFLSGTSMASPNVAGSLILLQQLHRNLYSGFMKSATLKAMVIQTAREAGSSDGPDYRFGWGLLNTGAAARIMLNDNFITDFSENTIQNGGDYTQTVNAIGDGSNLTVTVVWTDPEGTEGSTIVDDSTPHLVNDLDVRVEDDNGNIFFPWKLNVNNFSAAATQEDNSIDNVEKIEVANASGSYTISVSHKGSLVNNEQDFSIVISGISEADFVFTPDQVNKEVCDNSSLNFGFNFESSASYNSTTTLTVDGVPSGANATLSPATLTSDQPFTLSVDNLSGVTPGNYPLIVNAEGGGQTQSFTVNVEVLQTQALSAPILQSPADGQTGVFVQPILDWEDVAGAQNYQVELSLNSNFNSILLDTEVSESSFATPSLLENTQYFWRITPNNTCASGSMTTSNFTTEMLNCNTPLAAGDTPQSISISVPNTVTSTITIPASDAFFVADINVGLQLQHTYLADMTIFLTSPQGTEVVLMDGACGDQDNIDVVFDDVSTSFMCSPSFPAVSGTLAPQNPLSVFNGENSTGDWVLTVQDNFNGDGGSLNSFTLDFCTSSTLSVTENLLKDFSIYPNPAKDQFFVSFSEASNSVEVSIYDINGRRLSANNFSGNGSFSERISTASLSSGIYFVEVTSGNLSGTQKLIVE